MPAMGRSWSDAGMVVMREAEAQRAQEHSFISKKMPSGKPTAVLVINRMRIFHASSAVGGAMGEYGGLERGLFHSVSNHFSRRTETWQDVQQKFEIVFGMSGSPLKVVILESSWTASRRRSC